MLCSQQATKSSAPRRTHRARLGPSLDIPEFLRLQATFMARPMCLVTAWKVPVSPDGAGGCEQCMRRPCPTLRYTDCRIRSEQQ